MRKPYFKGIDGAPEPLRATFKRKVRFEEVDPLGIVWHGRYPSYFEDGRVTLGHLNGIGYLDFREQNVAAPIKQMHMDYIKPLYYGDTAHIEAILHWNEAARLNYEFIIRNDTGEITTTGYTVQLFIDSNQELMMFLPDFYMNFLQRWKAGKL
ncbi:MAG: acyl-CoA thioesterase [Pseudodesulfovibrio sp.]|nr:acyl-CoA thioesterase [Pseudodesulfovibrio sp.]